MLCTETWESDSLWWWTAKDDDNGVLSGFTEDSVRTRLPLHHDSLHLAILLALPYCMSKEKNPHDAGATACTLLLLGFRKGQEKFHWAFWLCVFNLFWNFPIFTPGTPNALLSFSFLLGKVPLLLGSYKWLWVGRNRHLISDVCKRIPYTESMWFYSF